ncbi:hypothetical protein ACQ4LE_002111 [Meloidogyne hapla]
MCGCIGSFVKRFVEWRLSRSLNVLVVVLSLMTRERSLFYQIPHAILDSLMLLWNCELAGVCSFPEAAFWVEETRKYISLASLDDWLFLNKFGWF